MLKFLHISFLVLIALIWKVRPAHSSLDVCDLGSSNVSMYCACEPLHRYDLEITCYVLGPILPTNPVWNAFRDQENAVAFTVQPRMPTHLQYMPARALQSLSSLEAFTIQGSKIETLQSGDISEMPKLQNLRLERNEISSMARYAISNLPKLKKLTLSENLLTKLLADTFTGVDELEELYLDRNNISEIEGCAFCNLHSLKDLELWRNSISNLNERTFIGLRYLRRLDLFNNQLKAIKENVFQTMPRLVELDLKNNMIEYISPTAFHGLVELTTLRLSNNQLTTLPDEVFQHLPKLMSLDLSLNQLQKIQGELLENLSNYLSIHFTFTFRNNPLKCGCDFSWLSRWVRKVGNSRFGQELLQVKCLTPEGEEQIVNELKIKPCEKIAKSVKFVPTVSPAATVRQKSFDPKYDSVYSDSFPNRTEYAYSVTMEPLVEPSGSQGGVTMNAVLLSCATALAFFRTV